MVVFMFKRTEKGMLRKKIVSVMKGSSILHIVKKTGVTKLRVYQMSKINIALKIGVFRARKL